jgi:hypothetical protein
MPKLFNFLAEGGAFALALGELLVCMLFVWFRQSRRTEDGGAKERKRSKRTHSGRKPFWAFQVQDERVETLASRGPWNGVVRRADVASHLTKPGVEI